MDHVFGPKALAKHKLQNVLNMFGGDKVKAYNAIERATAQRMSGQAGTFQTVINVGGTNVTVRGAVVNGLTRISTAFVP